MKKYLFGFAALTLAIAFSAFTIPAKVAVQDYYFAYDQTQGFDDADVQLTSNWQQIDAPSGCAESDVKACQIGVPASSVLTSPTVHLNPSLVIPVSEKVASSGIFRVDANGDVPEPINRN